jgi:uncharacterized protein YndB with AHSA1/START domain
MSEYTVVREYPYPIDEVWHVLTAPEQVARWTTTGRGGRPEGFSAIPGTAFTLVGKPTIGWAGVVYCEVISVEEPHAMHYTWKGDAQSDDVSDVTYLLEEIPGGTRFTWHHTGFTGVGGFAMSRLLGTVRKRMLTEGIAPVLADYHASGRGSAGTVEA